mgnify:CR=1 FL=1
MVPDPDQVQDEAALDSPKLDCALGTAVEMIARGGSGGGGATAVDFEVRVSLLDGRDSGLDGRAREIWFDFGRHVTVLATKGCQLIASPLPKQNSPDPATNPATNPASSGGVGGGGAVGVAVAGGSVEFRMRGTTDDHSGLTSLPKVVCPELPAAMATAQMPQVPQIPHSFETLQVIAAHLQPPDPSPLIPAP